MRQMITLDECKLEGLSAVLLCHYSENTTKVRRTMTCNSSLSFSLNFFRDFFTRLATFHHSQKCFALIMEMVLSHLHINLCVSSCFMYRAQIQSIVTETVAAPIPIDMIHVNGCMQPWSHDQETVPRNDSMCTGESEEKRIVPSSITTSFKNESSLDSDIGQTQKLLPIDNKHNQSRAHTQ
jgi:hypothetical protein